MLRTESQRGASRQNGALSQGPVTPEGKARSSQNAAKHGLFSDSVLLKPENRDAWHRLAEDLATRFRPADNVELSIIHDMAVTQWRKERALEIEAAILDMEYQAIDSTQAPAAVPGDEIRRIATAWANASDRHKQLESLAKASIRLGNYWMRLHRKLKELQADRKAAEAEAEAAAHSKPVPASEPAPAPGSAAGAPSAKTESRNEPGVTPINAGIPGYTRTETRETNPAHTANGKDQPCTFR